MAMYNTYTSCIIFFYAKIDRVEKICGLNSERFSFLGGH